MECFWAKRRKRIDQNNTPETPSLICVSYNLSDGGGDGVECVSWGRLIRAFARDKYPLVTRLYEFLRGCALRSGGVMVQGNVTAAVGEGEGGVGGGAQIIHCGVLTNQRVELEFFFLIPRKYHVQTFPLLKSCGGLTVQIRRVAARHRRISRCRFGLRILSFIIKSQILQTGQINIKMLSNTPTL